MSRPGIRSMMIVALLATLAVPWAANAAPTHRATQGEPTSWVASVKGWLANLWAEAGCILDPSGRCLPAGPKAENGCIIDPNGRCLQGPLQGPTPGNGCIADPSGIRCVSRAAVSPRGAAGPTIDNGCIADPNGKCRAGQ